MCIINASLGEDLCLWIEPVLFLLYQHTMLPSLPTLPASRTLLKGRIAACTRQLDEVFEWVKFFLAQPQETGWPVGETAKILVYYTGFISIFSSPSSGHRTCFPQPMFCCMGKSIFFISMSFRPF